MSQYHLLHRAILCLSGEAPIAFLQDILTADIASLSPGQMRQSCLLSPQGRILIEMTILLPTQDGATQDGANQDETLYIACDESQADELLKKLKLYRLRRKITLCREDELSLIASDEALAGDGIITSAPDERAQGRGFLAIATKQASAALTFADSAIYKAKRLADGIPEGPDELTPNRALMLEAGLDLFAAVDFKKGCYIGQEVTARTRWRGLVKRRLVPLIGLHMTSGSALMQDDKEVGTILATAPHKDGVIGLASLRLTAIHATEDGTDLLSDEHIVRLAIPAHLRPIPKPETT